MAKSGEQCRNQEARVICPFDMEPPQDPSHHLLSPSSQTEPESDLRTWASVTSPRGWSCALDSILNGRELVGSASNSGREKLSEASSLSASRYLK